jgi:FkbM family methyltransferase
MPPSGVSVTLLKASPRRTDVCGTVRKPSMRNSCLTNCRVTWIAPGTVLAIAPARDRRRSRRMQLKKAIDAGLTVEHAFLADPQAFAPSVPSKIAALPKRTPMPVASPKRPWRRAVLARLRPLVLPFLNRIDSRIRWAIDRSNVAVRLAEMERKAEKSSARLAARIEDSFEALSHSVEATSNRLEARADALLHRNVIALGQDLAIRTTSGYVLAPADDPAVLVGLVEGGGMLEPGTTAVLQSLLHSGSVMIDVGGHIGTLTLPAARRTGPTGRVIALEPAPRLAALLRRTMALNHIDWVDVHECAAGEAHATASFALSAKTGHNSLFPTRDTVQQIEVAVRTLDALVPPGTRIDVVKIDVEGAELQVWRGMQRILAENPDLAVLLEFGPEHLLRVGTPIAAWLAEVTALGHTPWEIDEETGSVRPLRKEGLADVFSFNILLLRDPPEARGLLVPISTTNTPLGVHRQDEKPSA